MSRLWTSLKNDPIDPPEPAKTPAAPDTKTCKIRHDAETSVKFFDCGHYKTCLECESTLQNCPVGHMLITVSKFVPPSGPFEMLQSSLMHNRLRMDREDAETAWHSPRQTRSASDTEIQTSVIEPILKDCPLEERSSIPAKFDPSTTHPTSPARNRPCKRQV